MDRCRGRVRHWRVLRGTVGMRTPVCIVCGSPNPRPLTGQEWAELIGWVEAYGSRNEYVLAAIKAYQQAQSDRARAAIEAEQKRHF